MTSINHCSKESVLSEDISDYKTAIAEIRTYAQGFLAQLEAKKNEPCSRFDFEIIEDMGRLVIEMNVPYCDEWSKRVFPETHERDKNNTLRIELRTPYYVFNMRSGYRRPDGRGEYCVRMTADPSNLDHQLKIIQKRIDEGQFVRNWIDRPLAETVRQNVLWFVRGIARCGTMQCRT